jgi:hypothetical protein
MKPKHLWPMLWIALALCLPVAATTAMAAGWAVGDKVQAWNIDWYDGVIEEVGTDNYAGYYLVRFEGPSGPTYQYVAEKNIRPRPDGGSNGDQSEATAPRTGRYICLGYSGGAAGTFRWYLDLDGNGGYQQATPDLAAGTYSFDPATSAISFDSGPYADNGWFGRFSVEREGLTHKIVLRSLASEAQGSRVDEYSNVYCTNSTDS